MTDKDFDLKRLEITKIFLETGETLNLEDLNLSINSSTPGIYHVFSNQNNGVKKFEYSISDLKLKELVNTFDIKTIKRFFVYDKLFRLRNKFIARNSNSINPLDFESHK